MKIYPQQLVIVIAIVILGACGNNTKISMGACGNNTNISNGDTNTTSGNTDTSKDTKDVVYRGVTTKTGRIWLDRNIGASRVATS
ncbi:MAG: hypothetical protein LGB52_07280, partial [Sulfurovum sp.]|nr:hypothetical protein [Sulfurovum sp.]